MSFLKDMLTLGNSEEQTVTPDGNVISIGEEQTQVTVTREITDDGQYMQFSAYWADVKGEIVELDHLTQEMYFCTLIKLGLLQKRGNTYLPPESIYQQMKDKSGLDQVGIYRKKSTSKGLTFGFDYESVGELNSKWKPKIVDILQKVEDELDCALEEAQEIGELMKERHRKDPTKSGKAAVYNKVKALFNVSKAEIVHKHLGC